MHYRHSYHAGNFADVFKHVLLCALLQALNRKDKPWFYLETHAGAGLYDLFSEAAGKTSEWQDGIGRLLALPEPPPPLADFLAIVRAQGKNRYPGSPRIAEALARAGDRLVLCEKLPEIWSLLKQEMRQARAEVHQRDGYEAHALLPPQEKRGLVLVDPPFESRKEFELVSEFLAQATARFNNGVYAIWYPLKNRHEAQRFQRRCAREIDLPALNLEFNNGAPGEGQMKACGLLVLNPPYRFDAEIEPALKLLVRHMAQGPRPSHAMQWIKRESETTASAKKAKSRN